MTLRSALGIVTLVLLHIVTTDSVINPVQGNSHGESVHTMLFVYCVIPGTLLNRSMLLLPTVKMGF